MLFIARFAAVPSLLAFLSGCTVALTNGSSNDAALAAMSSQSDTAQTAVESNPEAVERLSINRFELLPPKPVALPKLAAVPVAPIAQKSSDLPEPPIELNQDFGHMLNYELQRGTASWYGPRFQGRLTASGERYDQQALTAAHRTLPFGTLVRVRSLVNGREVEVRITDRGPYALGTEGQNRIIDVSRAAAVELDMLGLGAKEVVLFVEQSVATDVTLLPKPKMQSSGKKRYPVHKRRRR